MTIIYVPRSSWGADESLPRKGRIVPAARFRGLVVHHTVMKTPRPAGMGAYMRRLQTIRPDLGKDVPYSFVVFPAQGSADGYVCEGRGFERTGAHTKGYNSTRYGVAYAADTRTDPVTDGMVQGVRWVGKRIEGDPVATTAHKDHKQTACPGPGGVARMGEVQPPFAPTLVDDVEGEEMETLIDTTTGEHWVAANGKARPLSDPAGWMASYSGPVRRSATMKYVIPDLYDLVG